MISNTLGSQNTAMGTGALRDGTTGSANCAFGISALISNTTGTGNVAIGYVAGNSSGNTGAVANINCTFLGNSTSTLTNVTGYTGYSTSTAIGYGATITGNNQIVLGTASEQVIFPNTQQNLYPRFNNVSYIQTAGSTATVNLLTVNIAGTTGSWNPPDYLAFRTTNSITYSNASSGFSISGILYLYPNRFSNTSYTNWFQTGYSSTSAYSNGSIVQNGAQPSGALILAFTSTPSLSATFKWNQNITPFITNPNNYLFTLEYLGKCSSKTPNLTYSISYPSPLFATGNTGVYNSIY
jgi:hypothetical protein